MLHRLLRPAALAALLIAPPLLGAWLLGEPLAPYLQLPPELPPRPQPPFSWPRFVLTAAAIAAVVAPFLVRIWRCQRTASAAAGLRRRLPWWGYAGLIWLLASWMLAWTRFEWAAAIQPYTFTPIWLGYIVLVNALTYARAGRSLLSHRPGLLLLLFPASSLFWWFFEYLNRFVQNWHYSGTGQIGALEYFIAASLPFATVLPAVLSTRDLLATYPRLYAGLERAWRPPQPPRRPLAAATLAAAVAGLILLPLWPLQLYPLVWVAPLLMVVGLQALLGERTLLAPLTAGDWRPLWLAALASLLCGFFWELWNWRSLARWEYDVPYVGRFPLFEMPILGYAGYLPFGLECVAAAMLFFGARRELLYGLTLPDRDYSSGESPSTESLRESTRPCSSTTATSRRR